MHTQLLDRALWFDGSIVTEPSNLMKILLKGKHKTRIYATEITKDIKEYNKFVTPANRISVKTELDPLDTSWNIPEEYKQINIGDYIINKLGQELEDTPLADEDALIRATRVVTELRTYRKLNLFGLLRTLIYIIDVFNRDNVVWGVGRGSSVSSYVLYLMGVHDIDSVLYDLNFDDFLTEE